MDEPIHDETDLLEQVEQVEDTGELAGPEPGMVEETSAEYLGRWHRLVSTTNWEKGRIISHWRLALVRAGAPVQLYGDEAWSRRVGNVTPQHVGRLRRVYEQFGETYTQYTGLYWSHFQAALDWPDAEMWLEGAVQNGWSVAQMRVTRWETLGKPPGAVPRESEIIPAELDEDGPAPEEAGPEAIGESVRDVRDPEGRGPSASAGLDDAAGADESGGAPAASEPLRPLGRIPKLPQDLADAFETFKLAILNHKLSGWREVGSDEVLAALEVLRQLALNESA